MDGAISCQRPFTTQKGLADAIMFETLKKWLGFTGQQKSRTSDALAVCYRSLADVPETLDLQDKTIVVCRGGSLALRKEKELPDRLSANEVCWIVPGGDTYLPLDFQYRTFQVHAETIIRFEADGAFARYAATQPTYITPESLAQFVAGQWCELLSLQGVDSERLQESNNASKLRTHLSLLLQESGFRCVALEAISITGIKTKVETTEELPAEASDELRDAVAGADSEQNWERFLDQLDGAGFRPSMADAERLESLGKEFRDKSVSLDETTLQIQKMIRRKNLEIGLVAEDVARWNATDVKLRLLGSLGENPEEFLLQDGSDSGRLSRIPSTWHILRRKKVDEKLRQYLKNTAAQLNAKLETTAQRQSGLVAKSKFVKAQATLKRISDKIKMLPSLSSGGHGFKQKRQGFNELIEAVRRSITAVQLTDGILSKLAGNDYTETERDALLADLESTLQTLENEISQRKNIYGI